tara:strand:+ start:1157 stop:1540 length:384 start_codon:yes stop_codon:yes gene_type:complete
MGIKSLQTLVQEALKQVKTLTPEEALQKSQNNACSLIDIRDLNELEREGRIENSLHVSRGLLEFSIHPQSPFVKRENLDLNKEIVLFCAAGGRSALAAKTLKDMGFEKVSHIEGGFGLMKEKGFKII